MNPFHLDAQRAPSRPRQKLACVGTYAVALLIASTSAPVMAQQAVAPDSERPEGAAGLEPLRRLPAESPDPERDSDSESESESADPISDVLLQPRRQLLVLQTNYVDMQTLVAMLRVQAPDWEVVPQNTPPSFLRIDRMLQDLTPREALLWFEPGNPMIRIAVVGHDGRSHVSLLPNSEIAAEPAATEPPTTEPAATASTSQANATRSIALVVAALLNEMEQEEQEWARSDGGVTRNGPASGGTDRVELRRAEQSRDSLAARVQALEEELNETRRIPPRASLWQSAINPDGWFFRLGWAQGFSPSHQFSYGNPYTYAYPTGGVRLAAGRHFRGYLSVGVSAVTLHAYDIWNGSFSGYASVHTPHRFRVGIGVEVGVLVAKESNQSAGASFGWVSPRLYIPVEFAAIFTRKGGVSVKCGPVFLRTPVEGFVGYNLSVEWEFD